MELKAPYLGTGTVPGQFVNIKIEPDATDPLLRIPLGVHAVRKNGISLLYKVVGEGTRLLSTRAKGEKVDVLGPLGKGFDIAPLLERKSSAAVLVAGGHGVAPLYGLAEVIAEKKKEIHFFTGAGTAEHVLCTKQLKKLGAKVYVATEDGTQGFKGRATDLLKKHLRRIAQRAGSVMIFACGPRPMLAALAKEAKASKAPAQVSLDAYMACGIGACLGCAILTKQGYKLVCKDGPVFDAQEIVWTKENSGA